MEFLEELRSLREQVLFDKQIDSPGNFDKIIIAGMGGSGIAGKIFQEVYTRHPVFVLDDSVVPDFADERTLFISMSYSGNTDEVLSATEEAIKRNCKVIAITSGGKLQTLVDNVVKIPGGLQPRSSLGYMLMPLMRTFMGVDEKDVNRASRLLKDLDDDNDDILWEARTLFENRLIPVIYSYSPFRPIAYRWKTQFNENSKIFAYSNYFPELGHNEVVPLKKTYRRDEFRFYVFDGDQRESIRKRVEATEEVTGVSFRRIKVKGDSLVEKIFYLVHFGDYLTYHLALLRGLEPTDVSAIEDMKRLISSD